MTTQGPYRAEFVPSHDELRDEINPFYEVAHRVYGACEGQVFREEQARWVAAQMNAAHARGRADAGVEGASQWQPIETAPKETIVIVGDDHYCLNGWSPRFASQWKGEWIMAQGQGGTVPYEPTHWMPKPAPPAALSREGLVQS